VFTSDHALKLDWLPDWVAIIGSGYIGLEFSDVYTALGCDVTFVEVCIACQIICLRHWRRSTARMPTEHVASCICLGVRQA